ncbi:dihydrofolate reductase [Nevskia sp.]|uniref:dihydrofolate reductase n=1 Tax=Nevskia sp. TaxID=1929292 RepID=UPI0025FAD9FC|nr:dihydrofolate reductase [Nevskia sp.]
MNLTLIAALAANRVIGRNGDLPWRLPDDLKRFKRLTLGKTVLMGRKTWDSLGRPLPDRDNWVLSRDEAFKPVGATVFATLDQALNAAQNRELMVIGGAELYRQTLAIATRLELTEVQADIDGDTWFPSFDTADWIETASATHAVDERHAFPFRFVTFERSSEVGAKLEPFAAALL